MLAVQHPPLSFENLFPSYLNAALPHRSSTPSQAECSRRASINSYLVQRQTEWNWSIPSRTNEREEKANEEDPCNLRFHSGYPATTFKIFPLKNDLSSSRDLCCWISNEGWKHASVGGPSSKKNSVNKVFAQTFHLRMEMEDVYPVKYRKIYSEGYKVLGSTVRWGRFGFKRIRTTPFRPRLMEIIRFPSQCRIRLVTTSPWQFFDPNYISENLRELHFLRLF